MYLDLRLKFLRSKYILLDVRSVQIQEEFLHSDIAKEIFQQSLKANGQKTERYGLERQWEDLILQSQLE